MKIGLYFSVATVFAQIFNPTVELIIPIGISTKEAKTEIEVHAVTAQAKIRKCPYILELHNRFCASYSLIKFAIFIQQNNFLFHLHIPI